MNNMIVKQLGLLTLQACIIQHKTVSVTHDWIHRNTFTGTHDCLDSVGTHDCLDSVGTHDCLDSGEIHDCLDSGGTHDILDL